MGPLEARHLAWCEQRNLRQNTLGNRRYALARLQRVLGATPAPAATADDLARWWAALTVTLEPQSRANELSHVRAFYQWLAREGLRGDDPTARLLRPRVPRRLPRPIADADLELALGKADEVTRPMLCLAAYAGLRAFEIAGLRRDDVRAAERVLFVAEGKGGHQRAVPLHPVLPDELAHLPHSGYLFRKPGAKVPVRADRVSHLCNDHLHGVGVSDTLHSLRHWFATRVYQLSLDLRLTQELLGHADPQTTAAYVAVAGDGQDVIGQLRLGVIDGR